MSCSVSQPSAMCTPDGVIVQDTTYSTTATCTPSEAVVLHIPPQPAQQCRICLSTEPEGLIQPCSCSGSLGSAHLACLERWVSQKGSMQCEVCCAPYRQEYAARLAPLAAAAEAAAAKAREQHAALHIQVDPEQSKRNMLKLLALLTAVLLFVATMAALMLVLYRLSRKSWNY